MKKIFTLGISLFFTAMSFAQSQRLVLFEEFTGENCPPCASINPYVDYLAVQKSSEVVLIHYLAPIPTPGILSAQVSGVVNGRLTYYGCNSTPWGEQDGVIWDSTVLQNSGYNPATWCLDNAGNIISTYVDAEYAVPSPFTISVVDHFTNSTDSFYATVTVTASEAFTSPSALKLQMALVENLNFASPPGNNGETSWSNAVRSMYPSYLGTTIAGTWTNGQVQTYTYKGKLPAYIRDKTQLRFVAFIQDATKHVQQTGISGFYTFTTDISTTGVKGGFGNCAPSLYTPTLNLTNLGTQTISSCYISEYMDNVFIDSVQWTGSLAAAASVDYTLPALNVTSGVHKLSFKITSPNHISDPNPGNDSASLTLNIPAGEVTTPLVEGFENGNPTLTAGWAIENPDHDSTWRLVNTGHLSSHSFMVDYYDDLFQDFVGPQNNLYAPPVNLTYAAHATVKFDFANQLINFGNGYGGDSLYVDVSSDCGNTWTTVLSEGAATAPAQNYGANLAPFVPTVAQWKTDTADISIVANHDAVLVRFKTNSVDGNNFYLDNINIYKYDSVPYYPAGVQTLTNVQSVSVFPNPANAQVNLSVELQNQTNVSYNVTDIAGNVLMSLPAEMKSVGVNNFNINTGIFSDGIYFVNIIAGTDRITKRIAITH